MVFEPQVYEASASALVNVVRETPEQWRSVLLIGHQPGVQDVVLYVAGDGDDEALARAHRKFPTSAVAVLALPSTWAQLAPGTAALTAFAVPRGITVRR